MGAGTTWITQARFTPCVNLFGTVLSFLRIRFEWLREGWFFFFFFFSSSLSREPITILCLRCLLETKNKTKPQKHFFIFILFLFLITTFNLPVLGWKRTSIALSGMACCKAVQPYLARRPYYTCCSAGCVSRQPGKRLVCHWGVGRQVMETM